MPHKQGESNYREIFDKMFGKPLSSIDFGLLSLENPFKVKKVIYHDPATIVYWADGTKTIAKCMEDQPFEKYAGFCAAVTKKVFGGTTTAKKIAGAKDKPAQVETEEITNLESIIEEIASGSISCTNIEGLVVEQVGTPE